MNNEKPAALQVQEGGDHYRKMAIQPMEFSMVNSWDACAHTILKYISRHQDKNGVEDLKKAKHCVDLRVDLGLPDYLGYAAPIRMREYIEKNGLGPAEAAALDALSSWVYLGADRCRLWLLAAIEVLIAGYERPDK